MRQSPDLETARQQVMKEDQGGNDNAIGSGGEGHLRKPNGLEI